MKEPQTWVSSCLQVMPLGILSGPAVVATHFPESRSHCLPFIKAAPQQGCQLVRKYGGGRGPTFGSSWPQSPFLSKDPQMEVFVPQASRPFHPPSALSCLWKWPRGDRSTHQGSFLFPCSVQTAVINVFKGGGLQSNELYTLNENIRYVAGQAGTLPPWA